MEYIISIHAPPRGATARFPSSLRVYKFQFTPLREGRQSPFSTPSVRASFQFTPLREGRREVADIRHRNRDISIHAPPRGATSCHCVPPFCGAFQFTPLREGRPARGSASRLRRTNFNSRPSARGDPPFFVAVFGLSHFNSRPSARGDRKSSAALSPIKTFQFTPLREGRPAADGPLVRAVPISIHAPPRGATVLQPPCALVVDISIHAPPRGATAKDMQFLQIFCSTLTNQHGLTIVPRNLSRLFW